MNAEMTEKVDVMNEGYTAEQPVFDDDGSFDVDHDLETVESNDVTSTEPVAQSVEKPSEIVPIIEQQRAETQANKAREELVKFYDAQSQILSFESDDTPPDLEQDPVGHIRWMGKKLQEQYAYIKEQQEAQKQAFEQQQYNTHLNQFLENSVTAVKSKYSDFDAAADFLYDARAKQLGALSSICPDYANKSTIDSIIGQELRTIVATCAQRGVNPAEELYAIAKNLGYQSQASKTLPSNDQIAELQSRQNSARTLTASGGGGSVGPTTLASIDRMSEEEFDAWISIPRNKEIFRQLHGAGNGY
ncbi:hypothetical protein [Bartonella gliris]|uniref:hypothetical protein n=1 Tax=Bartonella gliris TaxID=3004109 RepID=UPI0038732296